MGSKLNPTLFSPFQYNTGHTRKSQLPNETNDIMELEKSF